MHSANTWPRSISPNELEARLAHVLRQAHPRSGAELVPNDPQQAVNRDSHLLDTMLDRRCADQSLRLWSNAPCVVITRTQARSVGFASAQRIAKDLGYAIAIRPSGGTAVVHRPGVLCLSLLSVGGMSAEKAQPGPVDALYMPLIDLTVQALGAIGIVADHGPVPHSYCDGKYSLRVRGRKIGGTAALVRCRDGWRGQLAHAYITVSGCTIADVAVIRRLESVLGPALPYHDHCHTSVYREFAASA